MIADEWLHVSGRGWIAIVPVDQISKTRPPRVGDVSEIDGHEYLITGIETQGNKPWGLVIRGDRKE
jgi:hypothetical protein